MPFSPGVPRAGEKLVLHKLRFHPDFVAPFSPPCEGGFHFPPLAKGGFIFPPLRRGFSFPPPCEGGFHFPPLAKGVFIFPPLRRGFSFSPPCEGGFHFPPLRRGGRGGGPGTISHKVFPRSLPLSPFASLSRGEKSRFRFPRLPHHPP